MLEKKQQTKPYQMSYDGAMMLEEVIRALGHDPQVITVDDLQGIADKLSYLVNKEPAWGWRYLRNILNKKLDASQKLLDAIMRLGATIDETPTDLVKSERVMIQAAGHVRAGALVLADSRPCANPGCKIEFVPRTPRQACHSASCAKVVAKLRREERRKQQKAQAVKGQTV